VSGIHQNYESGRGRRHSCETLSGFVLLLAALGTPVLEIKPLLWNFKRGVLNLISRYVLLLLTGFAKTGYACEHKGRIKKIKFWIF
jgi:hypothetical protein